MVEVVASVTKSSFPFFPLSFDTRARTQSVYSLGRNAVHDNREGHGFLNKKDIVPIKKNPIVRYAVSSVNGRRLRAEIPCKRCYTHRPHDRTHIILIIHAIVT